MKRSTTLEFLQISKKTKNKHVIFLSRNIENKHRKAKKAIFFDRDGVLIKDVHYIKDPENLSLLNGVQDLLTKSKNSDWLNIVITNQSGIAKKFFKWEDYEKVTKQLISSIDVVGSLDAIYANGENSRPYLSKNSWRKPNPNMILMAAKEFNLDLSRSIVVGDRLTDLISGKNAGIKKFVHVLTGHGKKEREKTLNYFSEHKEQSILYPIFDLTTFPDNLI